MPHVIHTCPAIKASEWFPAFAKEFKTEDVVVNTDAHVELSPDGKIDTGERHCPWCGTNLKGAKAATREMFAVLNGDRKLTPMTGAEVLRAKYKVKDESDEQPGTGGVPA